MLMLIPSTALGAAITWAAASIMAHIPAKRLGAFEFTRVQLTTSAVVLAAIVTGMGTWETVSWVHWPQLAISALIGVLLGNLALGECLKRGGPRRTQLLFAMNAPISAILGYGFLGETIPTQALWGSGLTLVGVVLAILFGNTRRAQHAYETVEGSLVSVVFLGLIAATSQAVGLITIKPAIMAGTDPLAASAIRILLSAFVAGLIAVWPAHILQPATKPTGATVLWAIAPGLLGYVVATTLLLLALRNHSVAVVAVLGSTVPVMVLPMIWLITRICPPLPAWIGAGLVVLGTALILNA